MAAAVASTLAQCLLWALAGLDVWSLLLRDARLTAALLMGRGVLPPPAGFAADIALVAAAIHFVLSLLYAAMLLPARRYPNGWALALGAGFGIVLYGVNLYVFTLVFPWFVVARGGITLTAHVVFGVAAAGAYRVTGARC